VLAAGIFSLILALGVARFAYTPMLPLMQQQAGLGVRRRRLAGRGQLRRLPAGALVASLIGDLVLRIACTGSAWSSRSDPPR
jgi:hypothetical protein